MGTRIVYPKTSYRDGDRLAEARAKEEEAVLVHDGDVTTYVFAKDTNRDELDEWTKRAFPGQIVRLAETGIGYQVERLRGYELDRLTNEAGDDDEKLSLLFADWRAGRR